MIERVHDITADMLERLRMVSEREGWRMVSRLIDDWGSGANRFAWPGEGLFVARPAGAVVGVGGLNIDPQGQDRSIGRVRRLYVLPEYRGSGIGTAVVTAIIAAASGSFKSLHVRTSNPTADRLYVRLGFVRVGAEDHTHELTLS